MDERRVLGRNRRRDGPAGAAHGHVDGGGGSVSPGVDWIYAGMEPKEYNTLSL